MAGGLAWGTFVHFFPTCGLGPIMALGLARLGRANLVAATIGWAVTVPLFPIFFYLNLLTGFYLLAGRGQPGLQLADMYCLQLSEILLLGKIFFVGAFVNGAICVLLLGWAGKVYLRRYRKEALNFIKRTL